MVPLALVVPTLVGCYLRNGHEHKGGKNYERWFGRGSLPSEDQNDEHQHECGHDLVNIVEVKTRRLRTVYMSLAYLVPQITDLRLKLYLNLCFPYPTDNNLPFVIISNLQKPLVSSMQICASFPANLAITFPPMASQVNFHPQACIALKLRSPNLYCLVPYIISNHNANLDDTLGCYYHHFPGDY